MGATIPWSPLACWLITQYQRHVSPRKGFCCAYRLLRRRDSCSQYAKRAIARHGVTTGVRLLRRRFDHCHRASSVLDYETRRGTRDRHERASSCANGYSPACNDADVAGCLGEIALQSCCELAIGGCHW